MQEITITLEQYLMGREKKYFCHEEVKLNAIELLNRVNRLILMLPVELQDGIVVASGWRPEALNALTKGASIRSKHIKGCAIDILDPNDARDSYIMQNQSLLETCGLFIEHPKATPGWTHLQSIPFNSYKPGAVRWFYP